jgi:hypothetical protein
MTVLKKMKEKNHVVGGVVELPLIQQFQCDIHTPLVKSMMDELWHHLIYEEVRQKFKDVTSTSKSRMMKYTSDTLERSNLEVQESIKKHYRKKSIKLHPDRNGEEYRPAFEKFTIAKDTLLNVELRRRYLREMTSVYDYYYTAGNGNTGSMLIQSHDSWMARHCTGKDNEKKKGEEDVKRLEGGLMHQCLKAPLVKVETR